MSILLELYSLITERFDDSLDNQFKSIAINLAQDITSVIEFRRRMADEHGGTVANRLAKARLAKWFSANYQSDRTKTGLRELLKYIANNANGELKMAAQELASLSVFSMPDKDGSKAIVSNAIEIIEKLPSVLRMYGKFKQDDAAVNIAGRIERVWKEFLDNTNKQAQNPDDEFDPLGRENRELDKMRGVQNKGAEKLVADTLDRISDKRIRAVIRDEVMKSGNKLATLDKLLVQYNVKF